MIGREEARILMKKEFKGMDRTGHALAVAELMESLARQLKGDPEVWYLTGLLHDVDLWETKDNMKMHGILAKEKLEGLLPHESIEAIMSHDPTPGIEPKTAMAKALFFSDVLDNTRSRVGMEKILETRKNGAWEQLKKEFPDQADHADVLKEHFDLWPRIEVR